MIHVLLVDFQYLVCNNVTPKGSIMIELSYEMVCYFADIHIWFFCLKAKTQKDQETPNGVSFDTWYLKKAQQ